VKQTFLFLLVFAFIAASCAPAAQTASQREIVTAYATSSAQPWMGELFACANRQSIVVDVTAESPDIFLRTGEPDVLLSPAYQIGEEEILIVVNRESSIQNLSLDEAQTLFAGQGDSSAQVWVYASGVDLQEAFEQFVMKGRSVTSFARVAANPQEMSDVLNSESNSVGILSRHWLIGNIREVYSLGLVPVLAITNEAPHGAAGALLACLQSD
jgi:hypothetical protein